MPALSSKALQDLVVEKLPPATRLLSEPGECRPVVVELPDGERTRLYVWTLTRAGSSTNRPEGEHKIQLKLPGQDPSERAGVGEDPHARAVVLGYAPELDVFCAWETRHYRDFAYNRNVQAPHHVLQRAREEGWAVAPIRQLRTGVEVRVAAPAERLYELVDASLDADHADLAGEERQHFMVRRGESPDYRQDLSAAEEPYRVSRERRPTGLRRPRETAKPARDRDERLKLHIRPRVGMYSAFARLNYKPWFAIAELVDNALQSYLANRARLAQADGAPHPLRVKVRIDDDLIRVSDGAAGIARSEMPRAFSPAQPPPDRLGLSEFGIGMKAAACWFANTWHVRTSALGEQVERTVWFDVPRIVKQGIETLRVDERPVGPREHYTVVDLTDLRVQPKGRTIGKIKDHLASIYRTFLRRGDLELTFETKTDEAQLSYDDPTLLEAPYFKDLESDPKLWRKELQLDLGDGKRVEGWAGLLKKASTSSAGFAVLRRDRLVQGSADETWRPEQIFKKPNKYTYQRLVGELHVDGFNVSHTKDGIQWEGLEQDILEKLLDQLDAAPLPLIKQAEGHRVRKKARKLSKGFGQDAVDTTSAAIQSKGQPILRQQTFEPPQDDGEPHGTEDQTTAEILAERVVEVRPQGDNRVWRVRIDIARNAAEDWYAVTRPRRLEAGGTNEGDELWGIDIRLNLQHPFSEQFINEDEAVLTPLVRIVAGLGLAEVTARESGISYAGTLRRNLNQLLRFALASPATESDTDE